MRLIDADAQYDRLADELSWLMNFGDDVYMAVGEAIRNQPTEFDIDKAVKELKDLGTRYCTNVDCNYGCSDCEHGILMKRAIEIVKQGMR